MLAIVLSNIHALDSGKHIYLEIGLQSKNSLRFIDIDEIMKNLTRDLCRAMAGFYAFTGCVFTLAFNRKGKIRPLAILEKYPAIQKAFASLGLNEIVPEEVIEALEKLFASCTRRKIYH